MNQCLNPVIKSMIILYFISSSSKLTLAGTVEVSTVMWGSRKTLVPLNEDWTLAGSWTLSPEMTLAVSAMEDWQWEFSSAMVLSDMSLLCLLCLMELNPLLSWLPWLLLLLLPLWEDFSLGGLALNLTGDGWGVEGGRLSSWSTASTWAGGPTMTRRTGRNTRPLNRPSTIKANRTRKKYLQRHKIILHSFRKSHLCSFTWIWNQTERKPALLHQEMLRMLHALQEQTCAQEPTQFSCSCLQDFQQNSAIKTN